MCNLRILYVVETAPRSFHVMERKGQAEEDMPSVWEPCAVPMPEAEIY
jgi:hypothetical protein